MKDSEVTEADMERVIETAKAIADPERSGRAAHAAAGNTSSTAEGVRRPLGERAPAEGQLGHVTGAGLAAENIEKCVRRRGPQRRNWCCGAAETCGRV